MTFLVGMTFLSRLHRIDDLYDLPYHQHRWIWLQCCNCIAILQAPTRQQTFWQATTGSGCQRQCKANLGQQKWETGEPKFLFFLLLWRIIISDPKDKELASECWEKPATNSYCCLMIRQEDTAGRVLFRHNPGSKTLKDIIAASSSNADNKENHPVDINRLLQDLSFLQRSSVFPGVSFINLPVLHR